MPLPHPLDDIVADAVVLAEALQALELHTRGGTEATRFLVETAQEVCNELRQDLSEFALTYDFQPKKEGMQ